MSLTINSTSRTTRGKGAARQMRLKNLIPATFYGFGVEKSASVTLDPKLLAASLKAPKGFNTLFDLTIDDKPAGKVFVRELQRHPVSRAILHCDLVAPNLDRRTMGMVPIRTVGKCLGVTLGGKLIVPYREMKILAKPADFPVDVTLDVTNMVLNDVVKASELDLPEGVEPIYDRDYVIVKVSAPRGRAEAEATSEASAETPEAAAE